MSVKTDVDRGLEIMAEAKRLSTEMEEIETRLRAAGLAGEQIDLIDPDREGKQFLAKGSTQIVPIVFTADQIAKSFQDESLFHKRIAAAACGKFENFYRKVTTHQTLFESGKVFRRWAGELLGDKGPEFVSACLARDKNGTPKSQIKIEWQRASEIEVAK